MRYLVQDDAKQAKAAAALFEQTLSADAPGFVSHIVLCEIVWVLEDCYSQSRAQVAAILQRLLTSKQIVVQEPNVAWKALRNVQARGADLSDALIGLIGAGAGCEHTVTFDKAAAKLDGFALLG
jgi:predicted nucleic-acid-binding protein